MKISRSTFLGYVVLIAAAILVAFSIQRQWQQNIELAKLNFVALSGERARLEAEAPQRALNAIYENLRTLASLPSVRTIDRHATNFSPEAKATFQQVYNNLAVAVAVSEVYVLPINFDPSRTDPVTQKPEEPTLMFDELILNAGADLTLAERQANPDLVKTAENKGPPEVEMFEYIQLKQHADFFRVNYPSLSKIKALDVPMISGEEVITCDNTDYITTGKDSDRSGIMFSVPFYGFDGKAHGMVTAIIRSNTLRSLLGESFSALGNKQTGYLIASSQLAKINDVETYVKMGKPHPEQVFSGTFPIPVSGELSLWRVWATRDNAEFYHSSEVMLHNKTRRTNLIIVAVIGLLTMIALYLRQRNLDSKLALMSSEMHAAELQKSEKLALQTAEETRLMNDEISRLNSELSAKMLALRAAQDDIIKQGKMAQLGNLIATVAHEIRNPLGSVRTSAFTLRRKLPTMPSDAEALLARLEKSVARCDNIIAQLLDFSSSQKPVFARLTIDTWIEKLLIDASASLPANISLTANLASQNLEADVDMPRMDRAFRNILANAVDAVTGNLGTVKSPAPDVPSIIVSTRASARGVEISIEDNGPGIPADIRDKVREALFTTKSFGVGLGLPAADRILQLHAGGIEIDSSPTLGGARATLWFALNADQKIAA